MRKQLLISLFSLCVATIGFGQITSVGLIGSATPGGWDVDTNMTQVDDSTWTLTVDLIEGEAKFRADDDWALNWGQDSFPVGVGSQDGPNIPIPHAATYDITFNSNSGAYYFSAQSPIGVIGSALPFGWDMDVNMAPDTANPDGFILRIDLVPGEAKFRKDDDWAVNWGGADFPSGVGTQDGPNIPIANAGEYVITFDTATAEYNFNQIVAYETVGLIGDATPGGWDSATPLAVDPNNSNQWNGSITLGDGGVQFSGNNGEVVWGSDMFPDGEAVMEGDTIPVTAGKYLVSFNTESGVYSFQSIQIYGSMGIIGDATPGGWDSDTDMARSETDSSVWTLRIVLTDGEAKFRADDAWDANWGAGDFPSGVGELNGANIPVTAGEYNITFNSFTLDYNFQQIFVYDTIGLIGTGTEFGDWDNDVLMTKDPADENMWFITSTTLVEGEVKFREGLDWATNWGSDTWPSGTGTQDGPNIPSVAGTWGITLNSASGEYMFGDEISSTEEIINPSTILAYPNPTSDVLNIDISEIDMQGQVTLDIYDMNGRLISAQQRTAEQLMQINVSDLAAGNYLLQIRNERYIIGKRFVVAGR